MSLVLLDGPNRGKPPVNVRPCARSPRMHETSLPCGGTTSRTRDRVGLTLCEFALFHFDRMRQNPDTTLLNSEHDVLKHILLRRWDKRKRAFIPGLVKRPDWFRIFRTRVPSERFVVCGLNIFKMCGVGIRRRRDSQFVCVERFHNVASGSKFHVAKWPITFGRSIPPVDKPPYRDSADIQFHLHSEGTLALVWRRHR
jgi:hypothetical protein